MDNKINTAVDTPLEVWIDALKEINGDILAETTREQANRCAKEGNVYFAALLRELADRVETGIRPVKAVPNE